MIAVKETQDYIETGTIEYASERAELFLPFRVWIILALFSDAWHDHTHFGGCA